MQVLNFVDGAFQNTPQVLENVTPNTGGSSGPSPVLARRKWTKPWPRQARFSRLVEDACRRTCRCPERLADAVRDHADVLAKEEARDNGKPRRSLRKWTFPVPKRTCVSTRPSSALCQRKPRHGRRGDQLHVAETLGWPRASARELPCTCSPGRWPRACRRQLWWPTL